MQDSPPIGQRYSLVYLRPEHEVQDSDRLRMRLMKVISGHAKDLNAPNLANHLERELGIRVLRTGYDGSNIRWDELLRWSNRDVLCSITLIFRQLYWRSQEHGERFIFDLRRVFSEEHAAYTIDDAGGVHPFVDSTYQAHFAAVVRNLGAAGNNGALGFVQRADEQLMPGGDRREAIRAIFDAAENLFKITFNGTIALNKDTIQKHLQPHFANNGAEAVEQRASAKLSASLIDWADACHNYRHAPGAPDPAAPSEALAVALVSQGLGYVRWLCDLQQAQKAGA